MCVVIRDRVVSVATRLYAGRSIVRIPAGTTRVSLFPNILTGCGALLIMCQGSSTGVKRLDRDTDHSTVSSAEVKNEQRHTSAPLITGLCLHGVDWYNFTILPYCKCTQFGIFVLQEKKRSRMKLNSATLAEIVFALLVD